MKKLKQSEVIDEYQVCPYCMKMYDSEGNWQGCCGENHSELAYETKDEVFLDSEVEIIDDVNNKKGTK